MSNLESIVISLADAGATRSLRIALSQSLRAGSVLLSVLNFEF
ncbi:MULTISPECIES: hypothetical protein [unclassified Coleofasciculus]|nr:MULTISPECIES: hypothetical protein [unclassified Coleofasciculus]